MLVACAWSTPLGPSTLVAASARPSRRRAHRAPTTEFPPATSRSPEWRSSGAPPARGPRRPSFGRTCSHGPGQRQADRAIPGVHARGRRDRQLRRDRGQRDPHRRRDGREPGPPPHHGRRGRAGGTSTGPGRPSTAYARRGPGDCERGRGDTGVRAGPARSDPVPFDIDSTVLGTLTTVNDETVVVAFAAGIAGMLGTRDTRQRGRRGCDLGDHDSRGRDWASPSGSGSGRTWTERWPCSEPTWRCWCRSLALRRISVAQRGFVRRAIRRQRLNTAG